MVAPEFMEALRILLVEDNDEDAELAARALRKCDETRFEIARAATLAAALPLARTGEHAAIVLDLSLPDAAGFAALRELALSLPHTAIIVLSGTQERAAALEAVHHGAQDCLVKGLAGWEGLARAIEMAMERKVFEAELARRANFDSLTGLFSRTLFQDRLEHALLRARRTAERAGLLFIDLDGFKGINDSLGHAAGDEVLRLVAGRFKTAIRESETIARYGGDEFCILAAPLSNSSAVAGLAERLMEALREPLEVSGHGIRVTPSIGIAIFPDDAGDAAALVRAADAAMFRAKMSGKNGVRFANPNEIARAVT